MPLLSLLLFLFLSYQQSEAATSTRITYFPNGQVSGYELIINDTESASAYQRAASSRKYSTFDNKLPYFYRHHSSYPSYAMGGQRQQQPYLNFYPQNEAPTRTTTASPVVPGPYRYFNKEYPDYHEVTQQASYDQIHTTGFPATTESMYESTITPAGPTTPAAINSETEQSDPQDEPTTTEPVSKPKYQLSTILTIPVLRQENGVVRKSDVTIAKIGPYAALIVPTDKLKEYEGSNQMPVFPPEIANSVKSFVRFSNYEPPVSMNAADRVDLGPAYPPKDGGDFSSFDHSVETHQNSGDGGNGNEQVGKLDIDPRNQSKDEPEATTVASADVSNEVQNDSKPQFVIHVAEDLHKPPHTFNTDTNNSETSNKNLHVISSSEPPTSQKNKFDKPLQVSDILLYLSTGSIKSDLSSEQREGIASVFNHLLLPGAKKTEDNRIVSE